MLKSNPTYRVLLQGVKPNVPQTEVKSKLAVLFKASSEQMGKVLETPGYILKKNASLETATKYKLAIEAAGGVCEIVSEHTSIPLNIDFQNHDFVEPVTINEDSHIASSATVASMEAPMTSSQSVNSDSHRVSKTSSDTEQLIEKEVWWYSHGGQQFGPVTISDMRAAIISGKISADDMAWSEGMPNWQLVSSISMLQIETVSKRPVPPPLSSASVKPNDTEKDIMGTLIDSLRVLQEKVSRNNAYLGVLIGFSVFGFALFLSWASIPTGLMATDGGAVSGWSELAFFAIIPLAFALHPVFVHRAVELKTLLINVFLAFGLLGYNNVIHREMWHNGYGNMGSNLSAGFWIGLLAMVSISVCGVAWSLHTSGGKV